MRILFSLTILILSAHLLVGCLETRQSSANNSSTSTWFEGAKSAINLGGIPSAIKVSWNPSERTVSAYRIYGLLEDIDTGRTIWQLLDEVDSESTSYTHPSLNSGQMYSYKVKAVGLDDEEDKNEKIVSTVVFEGISTLKITGKTTALVGVNSSMGSFDELRVYAVPAKGGSRKLVATANGSSTIISISGLTSGTTYRFYVNAYMKYLNSEDGNSSFLEGQTFSSTFGSGALTDNSFAYRGIMSVQAFGSAPNAPLLPTDDEDPNFKTLYPTFLSNPRSRIVRLSWPAFSDATENTVYKVLRSASTNKIDVNSTTPCTSSISGTCVVACTTGGSGPQICTDTAIAAPPIRYFYVITQVMTDPVEGESWTEELPEENHEDFRVSVHVPPDYMVLVQRDSANYEMCSNMGRPSNPRKFQRCEYFGIGATPYNSGPGKPPKNYDYGYYDFGYNLFIDRYRTACNWTRTPGACGSPNGCIGVTAPSISTPGEPSDSIGADGDVFFAINATWGNSCYIKSSGSWTRPIDPYLTTSELNSMTTIDPGPDGEKHRPIVNYLNPNSAFRICSSKSTVYGTKRLLRRREYISAAAFPSFSGEPNALNSLVARLDLEESTNGYSHYECPTDANPSRIAPPVSTIESLLSPGNSRGQLTDYNGWSGTMPAQHIYFIGTQKTLRCQTRSGAQDFRNKDGLGFPFSDMLERTNLTTEYPIKLRSIPSELDAGNLDLSSYEFGNNIGPVPSSSGGFEYFLSSSYSNDIGDKYIIPMGLPLISWSAPTQQNTWNILNLTALGLFGGENIGRAGTDQIRYYIDSSSRFSLFETNNSRWGYYLSRFDNANASISAWCAVEAE